MDQSQEHNIELLKEDSVPKGIYDHDEDKAVIEVAKAEVVRVTCLELRRISN